ncbi:MAG: hypothetical protein SVM80_09495 [Halobacteriota archaeon]|nr:hypothetical protein [Halobacteriota archaeon]
MRIYLWIIMFLALIIVIPTASALSAGEVEFSMMPLAPGETTDLWIEVTNYGADKKELVLVLEHHSSGLRSSPALDAIGILDGSAGVKQLDSGDSRKVHFKIYAASNAKEGIYNLDLVSKYGGETQITDNFTVDYTGAGDLVTTISVPIVKKSPYIMVTTSNTLFAPGSTGEILLTLKNMGKSTAEDTILEINPIPQMDDEGASSEELMSMFTGMLGDVSSLMSSFTGGGESEKKSVPEFTVVDSGTRFFLGDIKPGKSVDVKIKLAADHEIEKGNYNIPINVFSRETLPTSEYIGVRVLSKADLIVPEAKTEPKELTSGVESIYMVTVENIGKNVAKSVKVEIDNEYLSGSMSDYVGRIDAEDETTAMFEVSVKDTVPHTTTRLPVVINLTYQDDLGDHLTIEKGEIRLKNNDETTGSSSDSDSIFPAFGVVFILLLVIGIFYIGKKNGRSKKRRKNSYTVTQKGEIVIGNSKE